MKRIAYIFGGIAFLFICFSACQKLENPEIIGANLVLPEIPYDYATPPATTYFSPYGDSTINNDVATLGRVIFYDTKISMNRRHSCASCHLQERAFADLTPYSIGFRNGLTGRNTPPIINAGTQFGFFWDLREETLDHMVLQPLQHPVEMGMDTLTMEKRLRETEYYPPLFQKAFGSEEITSHKIGLAMAQFVKSIVSVSSKWDDGVRMMGVSNIRKPFPNFTDLENYGKDLFFNRFPCSQCHGGKNLDGSLSAPKNIGLEAWYTDQGMKGIIPETGQERNGFFKTPTIRNIELTGPYMHDGRFKTLHEVLDFYSDQIQPHPQLSDELRVKEQGGIMTPVGPFIDPKFQPQDGTTAPQRMFMSEPEKVALIAFMKTLTDPVMISDPKFSNPFKEK